MASRSGRMPLPGAYWFAPAAMAACGGLLDLHGAVLVREALAEVDGARPEGQGGHLLEDRDAQGTVRGEQVGARRGALPRELGRGLRC